MGIPVRPSFLSRSRFRLFSRKPTPHTVYTHIASKVDLVDCLEVPLSIRQYLPAQESRERTPADSPPAFKIDASLLSPAFYPLENNPLVEKTPLQKLIDKQKHCSPIELDCPLTERKASTYQCRRPASTLGWARPHRPKPAMNVSGLRLAPVKLKGLQLVRTRERTTSLLRSKFRSV